MMGAGEGIIFREVLITVLVYTGPHSSDETICANIDILHRLTFGLQYID